jgi:glycosyltransferase involved in cell wall biosynthesis
VTVVLSVYNAYLNRGGEDVVFEAEADLLEQYGNSVSRFRVEADELRQPPALKQAQLAVGTIWSRSYARRFRELVRERRPDVVHFHNTFPLISPSVYGVCKQEGAAVVQTLHNYRLVCPNALFFRNGQACEDCLGHTVPWPGVLHACYHGSRAQTAVVATMLTLHRLRKTWQRDVDAYIALTEFSRRKLIEGGLAPERVAVKPNFLDPDPGAKSDPGDAFLFVGRLAAFKGIDAMLRTWTSGDLLAPLHVVGDGPLGAEVERTAKRCPSVHYLGRLSGPAVIRQMHAARALLFPSLLYENFPVTIIEAFACGLPVIASRMGTMAEIVADGRTGILVRPGDADDLAKKVRWAWSHPEELRRMGAAARREYEAKYTGDRNYELLMSIYEQARAAARSKS